MANKATEQRIAELMRLPYRMEVRGDPGEGYLATAPELPGCFTAGDSPAEAMTMLRDAMEAWFESCLERGVPIPEPGTAPESRYSGKMLLRLPKSLHERLAGQAEDEGISINQYTVALVAEGVGARTWRGVPPDLDLGMPFNDPAAAALGRLTRAPRQRAVGARPRG